jgi:hypothetical protein
MQFITGVVNRGGYIKSFIGHLAGMASLYYTDKILKW